MSDKLAVSALVALSVANLEAALAAGEHTTEELNEALTLEKEGDNRKTAIEAIEEALAADEVTEAIKADDGFTVAKGKAVTTKAGIKVAGDEVTDKMLPAASIEKLLSKGYLVK